jgi:hypothetical protein
MDEARFIKILRTVVRQELEIAFKKLEENNILSDDKDDVLKLINNNVPRVGQKQQKKVQESQRPKIQFKNPVLNDIMNNTIDDIPEGDTAPNALDAISVTDKKYGTFLDNVFNKDYSGQI